MMNTLFKISALSTLAAAANAQAFDWTDVSPASSPTTRERTMTGTDGTVYYMYGGQNGASTAGLDELWSFDGTGWTLLSATGAGPGTRAGGVAAYDDARGKFVVFGGKLGFNTGDPLLNDTWEWDATNGWVQATPATTPDRRWLVNNGVYAPGLGVIFHGGNAWDAAGNGYQSNETWAFVGTDWVLLSAAGPTVQNAMMEYRPAQNDLILHGGQTSNGSGGQNTLGETWQFDLGTFLWTQIPTATTPYNSSNSAQGLFASMSYYNPLTGKVIVHGGNGGSASNLTWEFDGSDWTDISTNGANCRNGGMEWIDALQLGVYGPCNEFNGTQNRTRTHGPQSWGSFTLLGTDCPVASSGQTASLEAASMPAIGQNLDITMTNATASNLPILTAGDDTAPALPLSVLFPGSGAACSLQMAPIVVSVGTSWGFAVPSNPVFVGVAIYVQGVQLDPTLVAANTQYAEIVMGEF